MDSAVLEHEVEQVDESPTREFSFHDRCDRCGFQAYIVAMNRIDNKDRELTFCGHHGRLHGPVLSATGWDIIDFTDRINEKPSVSANAD